MPRKIKRQPVTHESFLFSIDEMRPHYSFGIGRQRLNPGAYSEHHHTEAEATCLKPDKFAGRTVEFTFIADRNVAEELRNPDPSHREPLCVGTLTLRGSRSQYLGTLPFDAALTVPVVTLVGGYKFIYLHGAAMRNGTAFITYMAFYRDADPEDY